MKFAYNHKVLFAVSAILVVLYVIAPTIADPKVDYGRFARLVDAASIAYILVLPAIIGLVSALLLHGSYSKRVLTMVYALGPCIVVGLLVWGASGGLESVRVGMILLAFMAVLFLLAGVVTAGTMAVVKGRSPER